MKKLSLCIIFLIFVIAAGFTQKGWQTLFYDDFNRADGDIGNNYVVTIYPDTSNVSIFNNEAVVWGDEAATIYWMIACNQEVNYDSVRVSATFRSSIIDTAEIFGYAMMAMKDSVEGGYMAGAGINANQIQISHYDADFITHTILATKTMELDGSKTYQLEFTVNYKELILTVTEIESQISETVSYDIEGTPINGHKTSLNGNNSPGVDVIIDDFKIETYLASNISSLNNQNKSMIYPNPVNDFLYFKNIEGIIKVQLFSIHGQLIKEQWIDDAVDRIDLSELMHGVYFLKIIAKKSLIKKVVKL